MSSSLPSTAVNWHVDQLMVILEIKSSLGTQYVLLYPVCRLRGFDVTPCLMGSGPPKAHKELQGLGSYLPLYMTSVHFSSGFDRFKSHRMEHEGRRKAAGLQTLVSLGF